MYFCPKKLVITILATLLVMPVSLSGVRAFDVITGPIEKFMDEKGNGPFGDLVRVLGHQMNEKTHITVLPWKRVHKAWQAGKGDSKFPIMHWSSTENGFLNTEPFYYKRMFAFVRKGNTVPTTIPQTEALDAAGILGFLAPPFARKSIDNARHKVKDETTALRMVASGRADYTIIELQTGLSALKRLGLEDDIVFDPGRPLWIEKVGFELRNDATGRALKIRIDSAMKTLIAEGKLPWLTESNTN